jgi:peptidyl-prolyl cis-trans isomerase SurA
MARLAVCEGFLMQLRSMFSYRLASALVVATLSLAPQIASAQVVALVNGSPVTELDVTQRSKLIQVMTHKSATRQQALKELVDDHLKIFITKRYGIDASNEDVDKAFANMAQRSHLSPAQMEQQLARQGLSASALKLKIRADLGWNNLIRGKFSSSLQINDTDIRNALQSNNGAAAGDTTGHVYTLYPITFIAERSSEHEGRRREAENLRGRFQSCTEGIKLARALRAVVVREPIHRNSADLAPQFRDLLDKMEIGRLTPPETTPQGVQMFALCERKENTNDSPAKRAAREALFNKRFEAESKKYLEEVRRQSMIEYR